MPKPSMMTTSDAGLEAGMFREGFRNKAYQCSANVWTFGFGSTYYFDAAGAIVYVKKGDTITREDARALFITQWRKHEKGVALAITADLTQNQFDTLADMCFNLGTEVLLGQWKVDGEGTPYRAGTGIQRAINENWPENVEVELMRWIRSGGLRDPGLYNRCASRVCQWNGLPFKETCYSGEPLLVLNKDNSVQSAVSIVTIKARARAYQSAAILGAASDKATVPATPAPPSQKTETPATPPPAVAVEPKPEPAKPAAPETPPKPSIAVKPPSPKTVGLDQLPNPNIKVENGGKPMILTERFWGMFWVSLGNIIQQMVGRGALVGLVPSWSLYLATDIAKDPVALGVLTTLSVTAVSLLVAAPAMIRAGLKKYRRGQETASQVMV